ncbi:hypothetical protein [Caenispirillum salinarum]|uniref:hypothetical protein n=1 Tax=Caenispirillum salinarum TaxID=859058 RepID=UPI00384D865B
MTEHAFVLWIGGDSDPAALPDRPGASPRAIEPHADANENPFSHWTDVIAYVLLERAPKSNIWDLRDARVLQRNTGGEKRMLQTFFDAVAAYPEATIVTFDGLRLELAMLRARALTYRLAGPAPLVAATTGQPPHIDLRRALSAVYGEEAPHLEAIGAVLQLPDGTAAGLKTATIVSPVSINASFTGIYLSKAITVAALFLHHELYSGCLDAAEHQVSCSNLRNAVQQLEHRRRVPAGLAQQI